ncbi:hypothetical protein D3C72_2295130 [compost metagenome]
MHVGARRQEFAGDRQANTLRARRDQDTGPFQRFAHIANSGRMPRCNGKPRISRASAGVAGSMSISRMMRTMRSVNWTLVASSPWR